MKKILFVILTSFVAASASADMVGPKDWKFEPTLGPSIGVKAASTRFAMNVKVGKEHWGGQLTMAFAGVPKATFKPALVYDYPFYFSFSKNKKDFSIGPTFNAGPIFGFSGATMVEFINIGFGARATYQFTKSFGVVLEPVNLTMGFVRWISGVGLNTNFVMTYDLKVGVFLLF